MPTPRATTVNGDKTPMEKLGWFRCVYLFCRILFWISAPIFVNVMNVGFSFLHHLSKHLGWCYCQLLQNLLTYTKKAIELN
jgi:hypothetical protein